MAYVRNYNHLLRRLPRDRHHPILDEPIIQAGIHLRPDPDGLLTSHYELTQPPPHPRRQHEPETIPLIPGPPETGIPQGVIQFPLQQRRRANPSTIKDDADGPPLLTSLPIGDILTAISGVVGAIAACYHRDARGGDGQHVDVSMYEPVLQLLAGSVVGYEPGTPPPHRMGSRVAGGVPRNTYRAADDRWLVVSGTTDPQVARVLRVIGRDDDASRARFGKSRERLQHADELDGLVARSCPDKDAAARQQWQEHSQWLVSVRKRLAEVYADYEEQSNTDPRAMVLPPITAYEPEEA